MEMSLFSDSLKTEEDLASSSNDSHSTYILDTSDFSFKISAPGKVILFGEHSVVYGRSALVAALDLRTRLDFEEFPRFDKPGQEVVEMVFEDINLTYSIDFNAICGFLLLPLPTLNKRANFNTEHPEELDHDAHLINVLEFLSGDHKYLRLTDIQRTSVMIFFYLFTGTFGSLNSSWRPFRVSIKSELTLGAGTGSSASFAVTLSACFLTYLKFLCSRRRKGGDFTKDRYLPCKILVNVGKQLIESVFSSSELKIICGWSLNAEKICHGNPSGVDNFICTYGNVYEYRKGERPVMCTDKPFSLILINTKISRKTKLMVEKIATFKEKYPNIFNDVMDAMDEVAQSALNRLQERKYEDLWELCEMNQNLLAFFGVSHPTLDEIMIILKSYGMRGKLTGAGGGGHAICFVNVEKRGFNVKEILEDFRRSGYCAMLTKVGLDGVRVDSI